jgi:hypothetical protein
MWIAAAAVLAVIAISVAASALGARERARLKAARDAYQRDEHELGREAARGKCSHASVQFGQTGVPGVATATTKWCRVCGAALGPAKLKESVFGNRWE